MSCQLETESKVKYFLVTLLTICSATASAAEITAELKQWHTVTATFDGPESDENATPNPFTAYKMTVWFIHPETTHRYEVPGYFAADGNAAETSATKGNKWRSRFSPPLTGRWTYKAELRRGDEIVALKNNTGEFTIAETDKTGNDFRHHGHLRYVGERYLQFAGSKRYFLKAGVDSPETLLGYHDFDGTWRDLEKHPVPAPHDPIDLPSLDKGLHRYPDHVKDWRDGDPTWQSGKGKGLIGGLNYLADAGVNSVYFLTMNVNGDGRNVWPWTDPWKHDRFDISKLAQWEVVFEHMQRRGIQMHVVLQETENDHMLDGGELGSMRKLYLREMVARFGHHPAVVWNLGEENLQTPTQQQVMAEYIRGIDPYDHPIVIHNDHYSPTNIQETFDPQLGKSTLDGTALQDFQWNDVHYHTKRYVAASQQAGKPWVVCADEMGGAQFGLRTDVEDPDHFDPRSKGLWGNLMGGGAGVEWYFGWQNNSPESDLSAESWRPREKMFQQTKHAVDFFQRYLPFHEMQPADHLPLAYADYGLAKEGEVYCIYLFSGGNTRLKLGTHRGPFSVHWFDPRNGGRLQLGSVKTVWGPGQVEIGEPPHARSKDWVCLVRKTEPVFTSTNNKIVIEAEHFESQTLDERRRWHVLQKSGRLPQLAGAGEPTTWTRGILSASKTASNSRFLRVLPDTRQTHDDQLVPGENFSNEPGKLAVLSYRVQFGKPGRYYVWGRALSTGTEDNGVHVGLNGQWPEHGQRMQWSEGKNLWTWACAQRTQAKHSGVPMEIYLDIEEAGVHTVQFSMREDGFAFDQFLLTRDRNYRPKGSQTSSTMAPFEKTQPKPADRGAALKNAIDYLRGHCKSDGVRELIIIQDGKTLYEGDNTQRVHNIWSCSKSFTSTALGLLIADGKCTLDTLAADIDPKLRQLYPNATLRDFTTMTSGFSAKGRSRWEDENSDWSLTPYDPDTPHFEPGSAYAYWDEAQMSLGRLLTRVAKQNLHEYLDERVFQPVGMGKVEWLHEGEIDGIPICNGCTNVKLNAKQFAKFGQLFLNKGKWNGKQIIPAEWVEQATRNQVPVDLSVGETDRINVRGPGAYGFNWWTNGGENRMPDAPPLTFYASGLHHNLLFVIPEWNMVIVRMGTDGNPAMGKPQAWNGFFAKLSKSMKQFVGNSVDDMGF
jgi:CubicO group peptidase (beta-lactamase class C family)